MTTILLVDDDEVDRQAVVRHLAGADRSITVHEASTAAEGLDLMGQHAVDCILLDFRLPDMDGLAFLRTAKAVAPGEIPPVIMLTGNGSESVAVDAMKGGVQDYLVKESMTSDSLEDSIGRAIDLARQSREDAAAQRRIRALAMTDPLTGIGNRNHFDSRLDHAIARAGRQNDTVALLLIDLDRFKAVNDTHGHLAGDTVLMEIARRLDAAARSSDTVARLGGDEFVMVLETGATADGVRHVVARLNEALEQPIDIGGTAVSVGTSIGAALFPGDGETREDLVRAADATMYAAKAASRQVAVSAAP